MKLTVLGSSSSGNGYILQNTKEALVIEAGMPLTDLNRAIGFDTKKIVGVLVTHEHGDHSKYVNQYLERRIPMFATAGTIGKLKLSANFLPYIIEAEVILTVGGFKVLPFNVKHDAAEPVGFLINHNEIGNLLFITDSYYSPYRFENLNNILIECNYREDILQSNINKGKIPNTLRDRTLQSHMSFATCKEALLANDLSNVNNIVLIHLSDGNSNAEEFQNDIKAATGKSVYVASKGLIIENFNKEPF